MNNYYENIGWATEAAEKVVNTGGVLAQLSSSWLLV